jgi:nitroreductase
MSGEKFENLLDIEIPPQHMRSLLLSRRSIRAFKEEPVSDELVVELIEAGIHAGTASNGQT